MQLSNLKTGTRLGLGFGVLATMLVSVVLTAWSQLVTINTNMDKALSEYSKLTRLKEVDEHLNGLYLEMYIMLTSEDSMEVHLAMLDTNRAKYRADLDTLLATAHAQPGKDLTIALDVAARSCKDVNTRVADMVLTGQKGTALALLDNESRACKSEKIDKAIAALAKYRTGKVESVDTETEEVLAHSKVVLVICGILALILTVLIGVLITRSITGPITLLVAHTNKLAAGDFRGDVQVSMRERGDELGALGRSQQTLTLNTRGLLSQVTENANTVAAASTELSASSTQIAASTEEISTQATSVASAAEQASVNINTISATAEEISVTTTTVAAAIEEMSASLKEVASSGQQELAVASEAAKKTIEGLNTVKRLGASAEDIGRIVGVIDDIASQTNLLALNATIEAATAGAAGKGFTVVATEVKALARQTAAATQEIQEKIETIQGDAAKAIKTMEAISEVVEKVNHLSQTIMAAVEQQSVTVAGIAENVGGVDQGTKDVARNVGESAQGLANITQTVNGVGAGVRESAKGIAHVQESANDLAKLSESLKQLVGKFKL